MTLREWAGIQQDTYRKTNKIPHDTAIWIPYHLIAIATIIYTCITGWSWWHLIWATGGWIILSGVGNNLTLHRLLSHKSWKPYKLAEPFLLWAATMVAEGSPLWWPALHRGHHHRVSDIPGKDLHTPVKNGWGWSYMGWQFTIRQDSVNFRYVVDLLRDPRIMFTHTHYNKIIYSTLIMSCLLFGPVFTIWFFIISALISLHSDGLVNTFGHVPAAGYRNFNTNDQSTNVLAIGYLHWGAGWHNNHHQSASSFDFGTSVSGKRWEFDPCLILVIPFAPPSEIKRLWGNRRTAILNRKKN